LLKSKNIPFTVYTLTNEKKSAEEIAEILNVDPFMVHKSIVITRGNRKKPLLAVIPGPLQVDLKKIAGLLGEKKVFLPTQREAESLTGFQAGGISPLSLYRLGFKVILDEFAVVQSEIIISGGERGINIKLSANDLVQLTSALVAPIVCNLDHA
jgi:Cys-tRNA(Pro)/Cys-tRNA(Cys) deacylase